MASWGKDGNSLVMRLRNMSGGSLYGSAIVVWFVFLAAGVGLGTVRELIVTPLIGDQAGRVIGTLGIGRPHGGSHGGLRSPHPQILFSEQTMADRLVVVGLDRRV